MQTIVPTVHSFPRSQVAYLERLLRELEQAGAVVSPSIWSGRWLLRNVKRGDICLLHWPSFCYAKGDRALHSVFAALKFLALLALLRLKRARVAWIAHNLLPHRRAHPPGLDAVVRHATILLCHAVLVHGQAALAVVSARFPNASKKCRVIVHGHFCGHYPGSGKGRDEVRRELGIPANAFVILCFGSWDSYKGFDQVPEAMGACDGLANAWFVVAGPCRSEADFSSVRRACDIHVEGRSVLTRDYVPDERVEELLRAADVMVLPYRESLTSGAALLAMSYGCPLVAVRTPFLGEVVAPHCGILYDGAQPDGLRAALRRSAQHDFDREAIVAHARTQSWCPTVDVILRL